MKSLVVVLSALLIPLTSAACPGGHLKILSVNGKQVAEVNMVDSSIKITDGTSKLIALSTIKSSSYNPSSICGVELECADSEVLDVDVTEDPKAVIIAHIREANANSSQIFKVTNFHRSRSLDACGAVVEALR